MPPWHSELEDHLVALSIKQGPPQAFLDWCRRLSLADDNEEPLTLDFLRRLADAAVEMTALLLPVRVKEEIQKHAAQGQPANALQLVGLVIAAEPQHPTPTTRTRLNVAQLLMATRPVPRDAANPHKATLSPVRTARFLAMWSTIYWEFAGARTEAAADSLVYNYFN